jgi:mono/diheme cytochrome c family protein
MKVNCVPAGMLAAVAVLAASCAMTGMFTATTARAQESEAVTSGRALVYRNCFQCHTDAMFRYQRQDRRAWEATIYRMIGRGALWTPDEISMMAEYLGTDLGPPAQQSPSH